MQIETGIVAPKTAMSAPLPAIRRSAMNEAADGRAPKVLADAAARPIHVQAIIWERNERDAGKIDRLMPGSGINLRGMGGRILLAQIPASRSMLSGSTG